MDESLKPQNKFDNDFKNQENCSIQVAKNAPVTYSLEIEELATEKEDNSSLRQVEAKLLDFNWIFTK